jgi:hypothetical protein
VPGIIVFIVVYFLPTVIASNRGSQSTVAIFFFNLLLGWTVLGWIIALFWSCAGDTKENEHHRIQERRREADERERQRRKEEQNRLGDVAFGKMSAAHALEVLGIKTGATEQEIRVAHNRLMKRVHPDVGGSGYFTRQVNDARDVLLG